MNNNIFIPKIINVGFQNRNDTYTKMLAYIIYFDTKGILRKEKSWESWRDKKIENVIYENAPTEGFVLNKKAGGYSTGWNHRQTYVRVYDPRGFEFEISIANLLYILENTNSIKGKGLEGEFVYGFDGKDLLLMPTTSPDYIELTEFNKTLYENKSVKDKYFEYFDSETEDNLSIDLAKQDTIEGIINLTNEFIYDNQEKWKQYYSLLKQGVKEELTKFININDWMGDIADAIEVNYGLKKATSYDVLVNRVDCKEGEYYTNDNKIEIKFLGEVVKTISKTSYTVYEIN